MEEEEKELTLFQKTLLELKRRKERKDSGKFNCIPFPFERLTKYLPGIIQGVQYITTASSGVGKTQLAKFLFVYSAYKFIKENPKSGISIKINYFALEESKEEFMFTMFSYYLYDKHGLEYSPLELQSMGSEDKSVVSDEVIKLLEECEDFFKDLETSLDIIDTILNPTGIYKYIRNYAMKVGTFYNNKRDENGKKGEKYVVTKENMKDGWNEYVPNDPDHYVINIVDHISLLHTEKNSNTKHETMTKWSADYARTAVTKKMKHVVVSVQQQSSDKEKVQYTYKGDSVEEKLEPSLDGLGDNKLTQRDALVVIGLFAPVRYGITTHMGYNINNLRDSYRNLIILKNRLGRPNLKLPLFFRGNVNYFEELPPASDTAAMQPYYDEVVRLEKLNFKRK